MERLRIGQVVLVEGKYDAAKLAGPHLFLKCKYFLLFLSFLYLINFRNYYTFFLNSCCKNSYQKTNHISKSCHSSMIQIICFWY